MQLHANASHVVQLAHPLADVSAACALRSARFRDGGADDTDAYEALFRLILVTARATGKLAACGRIRVSAGADIGAGYTASFYDLAPVTSRFGRCIEVGRLCAARDADPLALRSALAGVAALARATRAELLFGCASSPGTDPARLAPGLARLGAAHLAPRHWRPRAIAADSVRLPFAGSGTSAPLPPLLRLYLRLGAVLSDEVVTDHDLGTCLVFTALPLAGAGTAEQAGRLADRSRLDPARARG